MSDFIQNLTEKSKDIDRLIKEFSPKGSSDLIDSMNYSLLNGGKRLRPLIMRETFRLFKGEKEELIRPFLVAIEMVHTYSLIHDDLPAFDNDDFRRGKPSNHKKFGESTAILAGDGLLNYSVETAGKAFDYCSNLDDYVKVSRAMSFLFSCSGISGMLNGQLLDMIEDKTKKNEDFFRKMYEDKTAKLFIASFVIGALLAGADEVSLKKIKEIGYSFGIIFQLQDDLLDTVGDAEKLGKPVNSDEKNHKYTYLKFLGIERAREIINTKSEFIIKNLIEMSSKTEYDGFIFELIDFLRNRDN